MGLERKVFRNQAKVAYKKFRANWKAKALESDDRKVRNKDGIVMRCPTFNEWLKMNVQAFNELKARKAVESPATPELSPEELSWDE